MFLVDNGATMGDFWYEAVFVLEALYNKCLGSDEDGVDLCFTNVDDKVINAKTHSGLKKFSDKMWSPTVKPRKEFKADMCTALAGLLNEWLDQYEKQVQAILGTPSNAANRTRMKMLTIIVLTDGVWEAHRNNPLAVDDAIVAFNQRFKRWPRRPYRRGQLVYNS